jgi:p-hydroxybenzoate 3-monooxygenase
VQSNIGFRLDPAGLPARKEKAWARRGKDRSEDLMTGRKDMNTQVGIVGAGPAGLMLALLLRRAGIESVVIEDRSRDYIEQRVRAGLIEQWVHDLLIEIGVGSRLLQQGMFHDGIYLAAEGQLHHIDFRKLVGKGVTIYEQKEVVKDLVAELLGDGGTILFETSDVSVDDLTTDQPVIRFTHQGRQHELTCDFIGGCDGFHGVCRPSIPPGVLTVFERGYPFGWLGILAEAPPPKNELIYAFHERGFALFSMRSPTLSRLYLQCAPDEDLEQWPDEKVWEELRARLDGACELPQGKIVLKSVTPMRSFVVEPMQHGRLFLAGDAAHIQPPTGAKGMNLAFADVLYLSRAISDYYGKRRMDGLDGYSKTCLDRVWKAQRFSWFMTQLLHRFPNETAFDRRRQRTEIEYIAGSTAASTALAENYAGLPID